VIPEIMKRRNKAFAHPVATHPYENDNIADVEISLFMPVSFSTPYWRV
jgi:hypothetical protein